MRKHKELTRDDMVNFRDEGWSVAEVAHHTGMDVKAIEKACDSYHIKLRNPRSFKTPGANRDAEFEYMNKISVEARRLVAKSWRKMIIKE